MVPGRGEGESQVATHPSPSPAPSPQATADPFSKEGFIPRGWAPYLGSGEAVMTVQETPAGTPVVELSRDEYDAYLEEETERAVGMTVADFIRAYEAGELDDSNPAVSELLALLRVGQNGHRSVA
jgi:hypothetical protein